MRKSPQEGVGREMKRCSLVIVFRACFVIVPYPVSVLSDAYIVPLIPPPHPSPCLLSCRAIGSYYPMRRRRERTRRPQDEKRDEETRRMRKNARAYLIERG